MERKEVYIGLDYHSLSVQVCVLDKGGRVLANRSCGNSVLEVAAVVPEGALVAAASIESCCGAFDLAEALRDEIGWPVTVAHPGIVNRMRHNPDKSDYSDARMLAALSRAGFVPPVWFAPPWVRELRLLVRLRADLAKRRRAVKTRILAVLRTQRITEPDAFNRWTKGWLAWVARPGVSSTAGWFVIRTHLAELTRLAEQIKEVECELGDRTADDPVVERLLCEPGIGPVTAWTMRALIGVFDRFASGKQLSRFCAVTPRNASSGQRMADAGLVRAGDPLLKTVLIEAAQRLRRYEPRWAAFSERLASRGKPTSVIVAAIANRWVRWLYHQIRELPEQEQTMAA
jgi:transposase